ncbi:MAG: ankyrin repeat domain-containing protein, partial [Rickettsiales bacterium]
MESYLLVGLGVKNDLQQLSSAFAENNHVLNIQGDEKNYIDCENLNFPEYSQVLIYAHGNKYDEVHTISLCKRGEVTEQSLKDIAKNKALNFELYSCYGGNAINSKTSLSKFSTLITSTSSEELQRSELVVDSLIKLNYIENNPFIKFAAYIFTKPDPLKFAVQSAQSYSYIYSTNNSFKKITDFSDSNLIAWQNYQLNKFLQLIKKIQPKMNGQRSKEIDECVSLFQDDKRKSEFLEPFDIKRYKEIMLISEIMENNTERSSLLINSGVSVDAKISKGFAVLHFASSNGNDKTVKLLIDASASLDIKANNGCTALHAAAAEKDNDKVVKLLIDAGASLDIKTNNGRTALYLASSNGNDKTVKLLVDGGASLDIKANGGLTALCGASFKGNDKIVKLLVDGEASLDIKSSDGFTALHLASKNGHEKVVKLLVDSGASLNEKINAGFTALQLAVQENKTEVIKELLAAGASVNNNLMVYRHNEITKFKADPVKYIL